MLYLLTCAIVFGLQAAFLAFVHVKLAGFYAGLIGEPLVIVVVTVFVGADATNTLAIAQRWERILERAWAIILIDAALSFVSLSAQQALFPGTDAINAVFGFLTMLLAGMLVYAEPFAALENEVHALTLLPFAILRSMMLAWVNISRIFALLAVQIAVIIVLYAAHNAGAHNANVIWSDMALQTLLAAPLAALFTVAYLDTVSEEHRTLS